MVAVSLSTNGNINGISTTTVKFLCNYSGKILPRHHDGKLRYVGGDIRVLSVDRSISFAELLVKLGELCGWSVSLRCQLPTEDLDALISIKSDEDLENIIEEYDRVSKVTSISMKIRAFLSTKQVSPPQSESSSSLVDFSSLKYNKLPRGVGSPTSILPGPSHHRCLRHVPYPYNTPVCVPVYFNSSYYGSKNRSRQQQQQVYGLVHNGSHWQ
ncbi:hypothetical protein GIB67_030856 [Kingdonia uniflora]|uniref:PB1 domain-containing protein n=1 Tax=Kingdonia uniflora TaxID=39325 RepID=A0A7J7L3E5_9MAGN|nr:hypothetical protein GIB67_030856 [Kingdonia uniflora]